MQSAVAGYRMQVVHETNPRASTNETKHVGDAGETVLFSSAFYEAVSLQILGRAQNNWAFCFLIACKNGSRNRYSYFVLTLFIWFMLIML